MIELKRKEVNKATMLVLRQLFSYDIAGTFDIRITDITYNSLTITLQSKDYFIKKTIKFTSIQELSTKIFELWRKVENRIVG